MDNATRVAFLNEIRGYPARPLTPEEEAVKENIYDVWRTVIPTLKRFDYDAVNRLRSEVKQTLLQSGVDVVAVLRHDMVKYGGNGSTLAVRLAMEISQDVQLALLPELIYISVYGDDTSFTPARKALQALPREEVMPTLIRMIEPLMRGAWEENWYALFQLTSGLDVGLTQQLAQQAMASEYSSIREAGEDYLDIADTEVPPPG